MAFFEAVVGVCPWVEWLGFVQVREAIVFIEEPAGASVQEVPATVEELFKEMEPC